MANPELDVFEVYEAGITQQSISARLSFGCLGIAVERLAEGVTAMHMTQLIGLMSIAYIAAADYIDQRNANVKRYDKVKAALQKEFEVQ